MKEKFRYRIFCDNLSTSSVTPVREISTVCWFASIYHLWGIVTHWFRTINVGILGVHEVAVYVLGGNNLVAIKNNLGA